MKIVPTLLLLFFLTSPLSAQKEIKYARQGNKEFKSTKYDDAELLYRRSADENPSYGDALFNLGDALYKQEKYEDASTSFESLAENELDPAKKSSTLYNLGNTLIKENKLKESIEAYKSSLRLNPDNLEAKYNLAYAQDLLKQQEEQEKNNDQEQENKDQDKEENKENQEKQDKENNDQEQDQEEDEQNKENESEKDNSDKPDDKKEPEQNQDQISKEDAERLLQALAADEQEVQDKVKKAKASRKKVRTLKNW